MIKNQFQKLLVIDEESDYMNGNENAVTFDAIFKNQRKLELITIPKTRHLNDPATLMMSSGSTGRPKPIVKTNRNILVQIAGFQHEQLFQLTENDRLLTSCFCHGCGQRALFACLNTGALLAINRVDENHSDTFEAIHKYDITSAYLIPTQLNYLSKNCGKYTKTYLKSLRDVLSGGSFLNEDTFHSITEKYNFDKFRNCKFSTT